MILLLFFLFTYIFAVHPAFALDATDRATEIWKIGKWKIIEFAGAEQIIYRLGTDSIDDKPRHIVFDIAPSKNCIPTPAVLIMKFDSYEPVFNKGLALLAYRISSQKETLELTKSDMSEGDPFAFFSFEKLTVDILRKSSDKGKFAVWIPPSSDGTVKRSSNIYFSLESFSQANNKAIQLCQENR